MKSCVRAVLLIAVLLDCSAFAQQKPAKAHTPAQPAANQKQAATAVSNQPETQAAQPPATAGPEAVYENLQYRYIGPPGNRTAAVVGEPGNANVYYVGASSGGVWKSEDGGFHWRPIFDKEPAQSIGAIAIAPSQHGIV